MNLTKQIDWIYISISINQPICKSVRFKSLVFVVSSKKKNSEKMRILAIAITIVGIYVVVAGAKGDCDEDSSDLSTDTSTTIRVIPPCCPQKWSKWAGHGLVCTPCAKNPLCCPTKPIFNWDWDIQLGEGKGPVCTPWERNSRCC